MYFLLSVYNTSSTQDREGQGKKHNFDSTMLIDTAVVP